jgi:transposase InsO family protein
VESFNGQFRDEFLNIEVLIMVQEARLLAEQHRIEYNTYRPHSALQQWRAA